MPVTAFRLCTKIWRTPNAAALRTAFTPMLVGVDSKIVASPLIL